MKAILLSAILNLLVCINIYANLEVDSLKIDKCSCKQDLTPSGIMISHVHLKNQVMVSYRFMSMQMSGMLYGSTKVDNDLIFQKYLMSSNNMRMDMHMLMAMYGISNRLTAMGMLNYNVLSMDMSMLEGTSHSHSMAGMDMQTNEMDMKLKTSGFSDIRLHLLYSILNNIQHHILVSGGISIPAGNIYLKGNDKSMYPGQRIPYSMQLGSGTWDILPCVNYLHRNNKISWSTQLSAVLRTGYNSLGYKLGNEIATNNWISFLWLRSFSTSVRIEGTLADHIDGRDKILYLFNEPSCNPLNYGGRKLIGFAGASYNFTKGILFGNKLGIEYGIPIYQNFNGVQLALNNTINASWSYMF